MSPRTADRVDLTYEAEAIGEGVVEDGIHMPYLRTDASRIRVHIEGDADLVRKALGKNFHARLARILGEAR